VNERKTEDLVDSRLRAAEYYSPRSGITVEKQKSDSPRIQKLLEHASKQGGGCGKPEFLIRSEHHPDLIVVIECKADCVKHESETGDRYAEYAVDGGLLYGSYLSKDFDVLVIAASGQTIQELRISHHLYLKGASASRPIFGNKILPFEDYYTGYIDDPIKFNQDYDKLLSYSRDLNEILHAKKVKESQRSLLISGILIALQNRAFEASYTKFATAKQLAHNLVSTILDELSSSDLKSDKRDIIEQGFGFIKTHATLSRDKQFFHELIIGIDQHINSFRRTHKYFDTLGQFYIEFLRYANNDKGLGIVLTPPHITELFSLLANVNKDSVVYDNACGTSGFLISAMRQMVADAKEDSRKIRNIQKHQLIGVEFQDDIYALAVTNMVLHDDGKSNIEQGDCFALGDGIRDKYRPNVGLLNPPYKTKRSDIEELQFVLNNLHVLQQGGTCVAIVPMSCILADSGVGLQLKRALLSEHTLEGVLSMPADLFHNSKVGVITASLILTAHVPHPPKKKTWFGYCRDDGFVKVKNRGRVDLRSNWPSMRDRWVSAFRNREVVAGLSVMHAVGPEDEWCAEAYMETDYSALAPGDFEKSVRDYAIYKLVGLSSGQDDDDSK
jgi:type I restriction enzyme M protein